MRAAGRRRLGIGLSLVLPRMDELCSIQQDDGAFTLRVSPSSWRLTTGVPPGVTAPNGESHAPAAHSFGLGASLVAYDPYEILRHLAANPLLAFPAVGAVAVFLYRQLVRRFEHMEAPPRAKAMDNCFIEI